MAPCERIAAIQAATLHLSYPSPLAWAMELCAFGAIPPFGGHESQSIASGLWHRGRFGAVASMRWLQANVASLPRHAPLRSSKPKSVRTPFVAGVCDSDDPIRPTRPSCAATTAGLLSRAALSSARTCPRFAAVETRLRGGDASPSSPSRSPARRASPLPHKAASSRRSPKASPK